MIKLRPYSLLPALDLGWLTLKDHFIATVGPHSGSGKPLKNLLVISDAKLSPNSSFPKHPHQDMEILTWVVEGTLHHQDDKGFDQQVPSSHLQLMSAGDGIFHAEGNSIDKALRLLQIWIHPKIKGGLPKVLTTELQSYDLALLAGLSDAPLIIKQDLWLHGAQIDGQLKFDIPDHQFGYAILMGELKINSRAIQDGDGAELSAGAYEIKGKGQIILLIQNLD